MCGEDTCSTLLISGLVSVEIPASYTELALFHHRRFTWFVNETIYSITEQPLYCFTLHLTSLGILLSILIKGQTNNREPEKDLTSLYETHAEIDKISQNY